VPTRSGGTAVGASLRPSSSASYDLFDLTVLDVLSSAADRTLFARGARLLQRGVSKKLPT